MKGINSLISALGRNYEKLCCIVKNTAKLDVNLSTVATEDTLTLINNLLTTIDADTSLLTVGKTLTSIDTSVDGNTGNIPTGATEVSVFNSGAGAAVLNGKSLPAGVAKTFAVRNPLLTTVAYDGTGTQLLIDYMI